MVAAVRSPDTADQLKQLQQQHPPSSEGPKKLHITTLDVSDPSSISAWAASLRDKCPGLRHLDVVINNAGQLSQQHDNSAGSLYALQQGEGWRGEVRQQ